MEILEIIKYLSPHCLLLKKFSASFNPGFHRTVDWADVGVVGELCVDHFVEVVQTSHHHQPRILLGAVQTACRLHIRDS